MISRFLLRRWRPTDFSRYSKTQYRPQSNFALKKSKSSHLSDPMPREVVDSLIWSIRDQQRIFTTSMDVIMETLAGIDEISILEEIDKSTILANSVIKHVDEIKRMDRTRLMHILFCSGIPSSKYEYLETAELKTVVKNVMLALVEKMSHRELVLNLERLEWSTMLTYKDQLREALRLWVQYPGCKLFKHRQPYAFFTKHINTKFLNNLQFFYEYEIEHMSASRLADELRLRHQSCLGSRTELAERLLAFQEFIIMRVFNSNELHQFLAREYVPCAKNYSSSTLRIHAMSHIKHPNCFLLKAKLKFKNGVSLNDLNRSGMGVNLLEVLEKSHREARKIVKRTYGDNPNILPHNIEARAIENIIPSNISVDLNIIQLAAPIFSRVDYTEKLWSYEKDIFKRMAKPEIWYYVSAIAFMHYGVKITPETWRNMWHRRAIEKSTGLQQSSRSTRSLHKEWRQVLPKFYSHSQIDNLSSTARQFILLSLNYVGCNLRSEYGRYLKQIQDLAIREVPTQELTQLLDDFCWNVPSNQDEIISRACTLLRSPTTPKYMDFAPETRSPEDTDRATQKIEHIVSNGFRLSSPFARFQIDLKSIISAAHYMSFDSRRMREVPALDDTDTVQDFKALKDNPDHLYQFISGVFKRRFDIQVSPESLAECMRTRPIELPWKVPRSRPWFRRQSADELREYTQQCFYETKTTRNVGMLIKLLDFQDEYVKRIDDKALNYISRQLGLKLTSATHLNSWIRYPNEVLSCVDYGKFSTSRQMWTQDEDRALRQAVQAANNLRFDYVQLPEITEHKIPIRPPTRRDMNVWKLVSSTMTSNFDVHATGMECRTRWHFLMKSDGNTELANVRETEWFTKATPDDITGLSTIHRQYHQSPDKLSSEEQKQLIMERKEERFRLRQLAREERGQWNAEQKQMRAEKLRKAKEEKKTMKEEEKLRKQRKLEMLAVKKADSKERRRLGRLKVSERLRRTKERLPSFMSLFDDTETKASSNSSGAGDEEDIWARIRDSL